MLGVVHLSYLMNLCQNEALDIIFSEKVIGRSIKVTQGQKGQNFELDSFEHSNWIQSNCTSKWSSWRTIFEKAHLRSSKVKNRRKNVQFRPLSKVYKFYQNEALDVSFTWLLVSIPRLLISIIGQEILNGQPRAKRWPKSLNKK